jgi:peptidoglycan/xylan/chitin deacetylase (PgdA/CDA1 family)
MQPQRTPLLSPFVICKRHLLSYVLHYSKSRLLKEIPENTIKTPRPHDLHVISLCTLLLFTGAAFALSEAAPGKLKINEAGQIMVLMYHGIGNKETKWIRHRDNFAKDLETLYAKGYRPISLKDLVTNHITTKAGFTPIVLTFDDGRIDNFRVIRKKRKSFVDPTSAVGILERFHKSHPDFPLEATFFLYGKTPFGQERWLRYKLNYLIAKGMDIGNHTFNHGNLKFDKFQNPSRIQRLIGAEALFLEKNLTEHPTYRVNTYALCNGRRPKDSLLRQYLISGEYKGHEYSNIAIVKVGGGPSPSPATKEFRPFSIPRIRASDKQETCLGLLGWIRHFDRHPELRYVSDGDPRTVTVPPHLQDTIDPHKLPGASPVLYETR